MHVADAAERTIANQPPFIYWMNLLKASAASVSFVEPSTFIPNQLPTIGPENLRTHAPDAPEGAEAGATYMPWAVSTATCAERSELSQTKFPSRPLSLR